jgi:hypothetical protein
MTDDFFPLFPFPLFPYLSNSLQLNKPAELTNHHSLFTLQPAREAGPIGLLALALHAKPNLTVRTFAVPAEVAVRNRIY